MQAGMRWTSSGIGCQKIKLRYGDAWEEKQIDGRRLYLRHKDMVSDAKMMKLKLLLLRTPFLESMCVCVSCHHMRRAGGHRCGRNDVWWRGKGTHENGAWYLTLLNASTAAKETEEDEEARPTCTPEQA